MEIANLPQSVGHKWNRKNLTRPLWVWLRFFRFISAPTSCSILAISISDFGVMQSAKFKFIYLAAGLAFSGCSANDHSPTVDIIGSYFPAWIICLVLGLALTLIARQILIGLKVNTHLYPAPLVYIAMLVIFTLVLWLSFFKN
jgi:hypothetical protein